MFTAIIVIVGVLFIGYIITTIKNSADSNLKSKDLHDRNIKSKIDSNSLYKKKGIRNFEIHGTKFRKEISIQDSGGFTGTVTTDYNKHDKFALPIFDSKKRQLGFVPKGNFRLFNSVNEWHNGELICWGYIQYNDYLQSWSGEVNLPIGLSNDKLILIKDIFRLENDMITIRSKDSLKSEDYFQIFEKYNLLNDLESTLNIPEHFHHEAPISLIPSLSLLLEKEKDYEGLLKLEKYNKHINRLSKKYKNSTLKRIEIAKRKLK